MREIKIRADLAKDIINGKKDFEFRKLEKGITTGTYQFVDMENTDRKLFTADLVPIAINPIFEFNSDRYKLKFHENRCSNASASCEMIHPNIDIKTFQFVKEEYIDKEIDFIVYEISKVKMNQSEYKLADNGYSGIKNAKEDELEKEFDKKAAKLKASDYEFLKPHEIKFDLEDDEQFTIKHDYEKGKK